MYFLHKMEILSIAMLVYRRVYVLGMQGSIPGSVRKCHFRSGADCYAGGASKCMMCVLNIYMDEWMSTQK